MTKLGRIDRRAENRCIHDFIRGTRRDCNLRRTCYKWESNVEGYPKTAGGGRDIVCGAQSRDHCEGDEETSRFINCRKFYWLVTTCCVVKLMSTSSDSLHDLLIMI